MGSHRRQFGATHDSVTDPRINNTIIIIVGYTSLLLSYSIVYTFFTYRFFFYYINKSFLSVAGGPMARTIGCRRRESD